MTRASPAQLKNTMTEIDSCRLGPSTETVAIATSRNGTLITRSITRLSTVSVTPPKKPAVIPMRMPMTDAAREATTPTSSDTCAP